MPYNNTPINPEDDIKGSTHLPMSRVKKILAVDDEINQVSNHAVFLCTRAAELFVRRLADQAFAADKARMVAGGGDSNKIKKSLQYEDISRLVHRTDNLEFLCDVIPEATTWGKHKRDKRRKEDVLAEKKAKRATLAAGQTTLDMHRGGGAASGGSAAAAGRHDGVGASGEAGAGGPDGGAPVVASRPSTSAAAAPLDAVLNDGPGPEPHTNGTAKDIRFKHYEPKPANGAGARPDAEGDVQMDG